MLDVLCCWSYYPNFEPIDMGLFLKSLKLCVGGGFKACAILNQLYTNFLLKFSNEIWRVTFLANKL